MTPPWPKPRYIINYRHAHSKYACSKHACSEQACCMAACIAAVSFLEDSSSKRHAWQCSFLGPQPHTRQVWSQSDERLYRKSKDRVTVIQRLRDKVQGFLTWPLIVNYILTFALISLKSLGIHPGIHKPISRGTHGMDKCAKGIMSICMLKRM